MFVDAVNQDELDMFNEVIPDKEIKDAQNDQIREQHRELKDIYDNLERKTAQGRSRWEFVEPKVIHLWNAAFESNFTAPQLAALKVIKLLTLLLFSFFFSLFDRDFSSI